jgi:hypothetical protein
MPVTDLLKGSRVHVGGGLARVKHRDESEKEHHVAGQGAEDEGARAMQGFARAAARTSPFVVASAATAASGPAVDRRLAPGAGSFAFDLRRNGSKDRGHAEPCEDEFTSPFAWTHRKSEEVPEAREKEIGSLQLLRQFISPEFRCLRGRLFGLGRQSETRKKPNRKIEGDSP